jgi:type VI secretion system secreted protein VgrG
LQTAIVTGSETDEDIAVDEYGRVQVNFHWNMPNRPNAQCSCPVRVASMWAGKNWGAVSYPRVGQEVVVSFIEGDPDRPLIIGSVYNSTNPPPYALPANKTQSGIKSRSLLGETADFNELRLEDKKGEEDFFIHAQKDMHEEVENDHTVTIDHDEVFTIKHDQTGTVENNRTHTVNADDSLTVKKSGTASIGTTYSLSAGDKIEFVCGQASITLQSSGQIDIKGTTINVNGMQNVNVDGKMGVKISGMTVEAKADLEASLKGTMTTVQGEATAALKGATVTVNGSAMTTVAGGIVMLG